MNDSSRTHSYNTITAYDSHFQITRVHRLPSSAFDILNVPLHRTILSLFKKHENEIPLCSSAIVHCLYSISRYIDSVEQRCPSSFFLTKRLFEKLCGQ